jgi:glycosyltransferase involved in cell wall biosynthesis
MISVVIRARNEESWIGRVMFALNHQRAQDLDVILVDNDSTDNTADIAESHGAKILTISRSDFSFGRAINRGIEIAKFETVAILSAHCIPVNDLWADYMESNFRDQIGLPHINKRICGVYGRQEPLPDTDSFDQRDLWTTFREERIHQHKDYFFHNGNSAVLKSIWREHPFDEDLQGVEDREWAKRMIGLGHTIVYEPNARVYHHHGIHHGRNRERAQRVASVIEVIRSSSK